MNEQYKKTIMKMATDAFRDLKSDLAGFLESRSLNNFGAGISGVGMDSRTLAEKVLEFIYIENSKEDYRAMMSEVEGADEGE